MIGRLVGDIRTIYGIPAEKLADGLCTTGMLKKYENGETKPEKLLADALLQRLGKSMDKYDVMLDEKEYTLAVERAYMQELMRRGRLDEAQEHLSGYSGLPGAGKPLHRQFACLQWAELYRRKKMPHKEQERFVLEGLSQTIHQEIRPEIMKPRLFSLLEMYLLERYAILQEEQGNEENAALWYQQIMGYLDQKGKGCIEYDLADKRKLYPLMAYRLAAYYARRMIYRPALELIETGCEMLSRQKKQSALFVHMEELKIRILQASGRKMPVWETSCLKYMQEAVGEEAGKWKENWYPSYIELKLHSVNDTIRERRQALGWSEEDLEDGVCDVRTIHQIENTKRKPQKRVRTALLKKLGLSDIKYDGTLATGKYTDFRKAVEMETERYNGNIVKAEQLYTELIHGMDKKLVTNHQFRQYYKITLRYNKKELSEEEYCSGLWELLKETLPGGSDEKNGNCILMHHERIFLKNLAWIAEGENAERAEKILLGQYERFENGRALKSFFGDYYVGVAYCLGRSNKNKQNFKLAKHYTDTVLKQMFLLEENTNWARLLFMRFQIVEEERNCQTEKRIAEEELHQWVRYSYAVARLYSRDNVFMDWIEDYLVREYDNKEEILGELMGDC